MIVAIAAGCGNAARKAAPAPCVLRVYFCTTVSCGHDASKRQIRDVSRRLGSDDDVFSVQLVDKREALRLMREHHPEMTQDLPTNPFPDSLRVRPVAGVGMRMLATKVHAGRDGVHAVKFTRDPACRAST